MSMKEFRYFAPPHLDQGVEAVAGIEQAAPGHSLIMMGATINYC